MIKTFLADETEAPNDTIFGRDSPSKLMSRRSSTRIDLFSVASYNPKTMKSMKNKLKAYDTVIAILNVLLFVFNFIQHEIYFLNDNELTESCNIIRIMCVVLSLASILWLIRRYKVKLIMKLIRFEI